MAKDVASKKELEILLSQLKGFQNPKAKLEQYNTHASIAADLLWNANMQKHISNKTIADLGCGPGIFGFGALLLGAKKVYFIDLDQEALDVAVENRKIIEKVLGRKINCEFQNLNVKDFDKKVNVVIQNPPFGTKQTHHDKLFLVRAMELAKVIYSFHKTSTKGFVNKFVKENGYKVKKVYNYKFPIKKMYWFHLSKMKEIEVSCWYISK